MLLIRVNPRQSVSQIALGVQSVALPVATKKAQSVRKNFLIIHI
jgi:hypothetical protein